MGSLDGRVALVTGASRGIGRAIAVALAAQGASVAAAARGENAQDAVDEIRAKGGTAERFSMDVTDTASVNGVVASTLEKFGRLDILVNNAGITKDQLLLRMKREDWDAVIGTNLTGAFSCSQAALKPMLKQRSGRIINISSVVGQAGNAGQASYVASKAGLIGLTKTLALEVASRGITVNAVSPGYIATDMTRVVAEGAQNQWAEKIPMQRAGRPEEVASAVVFLASDEASYITGHVLAVNGGMYM